MKTINYTENSYIVSEKHPISHDEPGFIWKECDLKIGTFKWCSVYYYQSDTQIYIKPINREFDRNFENIFGFGFNCRNYDDKKVVWLKNAKLI